MQTRVAQYLNEVVSLTMLALLVVAFVAGQSHEAKEAIAAADNATAVVAELSLSIRQQGE